MQSRFFSLLAVAALVLAGCAKATKTPLGLAEARALMSGAYEGRYNRGVEHFSFRPDGTFSQEFIRGDAIVYQSKGTWRCERFEDHYLVWLEPFMDLRDAITERGAVQRVSSCMAHFYEDEAKIWFFRDIDYYVRKEKA